MGKGFDFEHLNFIEASEVPMRAKNEAYYKGIFQRIPEGKALVLSEKEISILCLRQALYRLQRKGEFKKMRIVERQRGTSEATIYVINPTSGKRS